MREKLIELLGGDMCKGCYCEDCEHENNEKACIEHIKSKMADHLIANGVTVAKDTNVLTNADRIRAMSDEELAEIIICPKQIHITAQMLVCQIDCDLCVLEWLQQPAEEG